MELTVVRNTTLNLPGGLGSFLNQEENLLPKSRRKSEHKRYYEIHFLKQWKQWWNKLMRLFPGHTQIGNVSPQKFEVKSSTQCQRLKLLLLPACISMKSQPIFQT